MVHCTAHQLCSQLSGADNMGSGRLILLGSGRPEGWIDADFCSNDNLFLYPDRVPAPCSVMKSNEGCPQDHTGCGA